MNHLFHLLDKSGRGVHYGVEMDLIALRELYTYIHDANNQDNEYMIACKDWQVSYYEKVFGSNVSYIVIDELPDAVTNS